MRSAMLIVLVFLLAISGLAQDEPKKDSLLNLLAVIQDDSTRIMLFLQVSDIYSTADFDSALLYIHKAQDLAREKGIRTCDQYINTTFAEYYYYNNDYRQANEYALKNLAIAEANNDDKLLARTYNNLAAIYNHFGNHKSAIDYALKCLALSERTKDSASFPIRNLTASVTYYNLKKFDESIFYSKRAIDFGKQFNNSFAVMMGLNNMGAAYSEKHKIDTAITIFIQQLEFAQKQADIVNVGYALINLCQNYFFINDLAGVEKYADMLNKVGPQIRDKNTIAEMYNVHALKYILRKEYPLAKVQLDNGIALAKKENAGDALGGLYHSYARFYFIQNKIKEAEDYSYKYDSLQRAANLKELNFYLEDLGVQYETAKKVNLLNLQHIQLKQKNSLIYSLSTGALALLTISLLSYRNYHHRQKLQQAKIDELETEKQLAATAAVLKGEEQERTRLAKDLHDGLGGMLSGIKFSLNRMKGNLVLTPDNAQAFERSLDMLDSSIHEMRRVAHNMMPEILVRYGLDAALKEFCSEIDRSGVIHVNYQSVGTNNLILENTTAVTVYRIIQELVNNTLKHAHAKSILVQLHQFPQERLLAITVEDDGIGFDPKMLNRSGGIGWQSIQNRVEFLKARVDIQSSSGKGTSVMIEISI